MPLTLLARSVLTLLLSGAPITPEVMPPTSPLATRLQQEETSADPRCDVATTPLSRATVDGVRLREEALRASFGGQWRRAASAMLRAVGKLGRDTPCGIASLDRAADYLYHAGDRQAARVALEEASTRALANGDLVQAAESLVRAAFVARAMGAQAEALDLAQRARRLANSPLLSSVERSRILTAAGLG